MSQCDLLAPPPPPPGWVPPELGAPVDPEEPRSKFRIIQQLLLFVRCPMHKVAPATIHRLGMSVCGPCHQGGRR